MKTVHNQKIVALAVAAVMFNKSENVRDEVADYKDIAGLMADMRDNGQKDPIVVSKRANGEIHVLRGFRRFAANLGNLSLYPEGYQLDDPDSGKATLRKFDKIEAIVLEGLTPQEEFTIMSDHGNSKPLSQVGLHNSMMRGFAMGKNEKWIVNSMRGAIDQRYQIPDSKAKELVDKVNAKLQGIDPASPRYAVEKAKAEEEAYFQYRRGLIQTVNRVFQSPVIMQDAYVCKLRGDQSYPTDADVKELLPVYEAEKKADGVAGNITKANPGPKFLAAWDKIVTSRETAEANGTKRAATSMLTRADVEELVKATNSKILTLDRNMILRNVPRERAVEFDELCVAVEAGMSQELSDKFRDFIASLGVAEAVAAKAE